jgi:peptide/nickel transport system substrate-binding protein
MKIDLVKILLTATIISVLLAPLVTSPAIAQPRYGGRLVWGIGSDPPTLRGASASTFLFQQVQAQPFNCLVSNDFNTGEWKPELAESWQISPDGLRVVFNLVRNATWHDGKPFTSADVKFSLLKVNPKYVSFAASFNESVKSIDTPDDYTVVINMKKPFPAMLSPSIGIGGSGWSIVPKHLYENTDFDTNPYNVKPVGTGAWKFEEWARGDHITFVRNEKYFKKGLPYLDKMIYKVIPATAARALAFEKGEVDFMWAMVLAYSDGARLMKDIQDGKLPGKKVWLYPSQSGSCDVLIFNLQPEGPAFFKDVRVRKAIAYAIDQKKICDLVYYGTALPQLTPVSSAPACRWYYDADSKQPAYDPSMANKLLDEAGYKKGPDGIRFKMRISVDSIGYPTHLKEGEIFKDLLKEVGIDLNIVSLETAAWHDAVFTRWDFDTFVFPMSTGPDPMLVQQYYTGKGIRRVSWSNAGGYNNSKVNELFYASEVEMNRAKRADLVKQATKIMVEDQAAVWLVTRQYVNALNLDFSDQFQPGVWEYGGGIGFARTEGVYWLKAPAPTTPTKTTTTVTTPTAAPAIGTETIALIVVIAVVVIAAVYWMRKPQKKAT